MQIAVQGDFLLKGDTHAENDFLLQMLLPALENRQVSLIFMASTTRQQQLLQPYGTVHLLPPPRWLPVNSWAEKWKYRQQVPHFLKKQPTSLLITSRPVAVHQPQLLIIATPHAVEQPGFSGKIVVPTNWAATEMTTLYGIAAEKLQVISAAPPTNSAPADWETRETTKNSYTDGCEYFIFSTAEPAAADLLYLFKAFSVFKKWQKSSMKLVITNVPEVLLPELETYRYRNDVVLLQNIDHQEILSIVAGAYSMVYPVPEDTTGMPLLSAFASEVPVITVQTPALQEIGAEVVLYADAADFNSMGQQMIQLYKNESLRNNLALAGKNRVASSSRQQSSRQLWQVIEGLTS